MGRKRWGDGGYRYTQRGHTWDPCPGCGEEPKAFYPSKGVCAECAALLRWARDERKHAEALKGVVLRLVPFFAYRLPYIHSAAHGDRELHDVLRNTIHAIVMAMVPVYGGAGRILYRMEGTSKDGALPKGSEGSFMVIPGGIVAIQ